MLNHLGFRLFLPLVLLALSNGVAAVGLGELRGHPYLGERPKLEIDLLGAEKQKIDASCFRLVQPTGSGDLPWLKSANLSVRIGTPPVLEIRSDVPLREPVIELAIKLGCGHEVFRQYVLLVSPGEESVAPPVAPSPERETSPVPAPRVRPRVPRALPVAVEPVESPPQLAPRRTAKRQAASGLPDRLMLSSGVDAEEPSLRLATELFAGNAGNAEVREAQREILRLEFRMLMALNEQATSQLATAEKLRNMEATLGELQQRAADFAQRAENGESRAESLGSKPESTTPPSVPAEVNARPAPAVDGSSGFSEWSLYGVLLGAILGLAGWLGWKNYRQRQQRLAAQEYQLLAPALTVDPQRDSEQDDLGHVDLHVESDVTGLPMQIDVELDGGDVGAAIAPVAPSNAAPRPDSLMSISATTLDEHFEANPVMELADIMLSFGRVKGAAQALQEYIDNNPQEALQPWIRLMDVYRMAGMRTEFETVASNLNQNFNVEIQQWDIEQPIPNRHSMDLVPDDAEPIVTPVVARPESLEDMPRIVNMICQLWEGGDVVGYLYQLLRDNRGGKRLGFALPVVEEILFLVELKETSNRIN